MHEERTWELQLSPLPAATKMAQLIFSDKNYVSQCILNLYLHLSIHAVYLVPDLEGSDNGDPLNGEHLSLTVSV